MIFEQIRVDGDRNFGYLIGDETSRQAAIVDASYAPERELETPERNGLKVKYVISTHSHPDHIAGNSYVVERTSAPEVLHESTPHPCSMRVKDNDELTVGNLKLRFLYTPGHIPDHVCVLVGNKVLTGDILFVGKVGGTGGPMFPLSDPRQQWDSLHRLMLLDRNIEVWPGHDYGVRPSSTIGDEIDTNPFLLTKTYDEFLHLKEHWAEYKKAHNIA
jgi:glyoxylase-like metal-dependent hydrolase (beta-lactamase superfamily II)